MVRVFGRRLPLAFRARMRWREGIRASRPTGTWRSWASLPSRRGGAWAPSYAPGAQTLDAEGIPAYLEASTVRSRALYERHGFEVTGEFNFPSGGPPLWQMWREPGS